VQTKHLPGGLWIRLVLFLNGLVGSQEQGLIVVKVSVALSVVPEIGEFRGRDRGIQG
jgi:hypothetical protein